jgi:phage shock protein PspC (stress-responsive transcriptional regulator)
MLFGAVLTMILAYVIAALRWSPKTGQVAKRESCP